MYCFNLKQYMAKLFKKLKEKITGDPVASASIDDSNPGPILILSPNDTRRLHILTALAQNHFREINPTNILEIIKKENQITNTTEKNTYKSYIDTIFQNGNRKEVEDLLKNFKKFSNNELSKLKNTINTRLREKTTTKKSSSGNRKRTKKSTSSNTYISVNIESNSNSNNTLPPTPPRPPKLASQLVVSSSRPIPPPRPPKPSQSAVTSRPPIPTPRPSKLPSQSAVASRPPISTNVAPPVVINNGIYSEANNRMISSRIRTFRKKKSINK